MLAGNFGKLRILLCLALPLATGAANGQKFKWRDEPEYVDRFFLGKVSDLPGFGEHHRRLQRLLRTDPSGAKLREGLRLIEGKEDGTAARIFASWFAQLDSPDIKIQEFRVLTRVSSRVAPTAPVIRKRDFANLTIGYFLGSIVKPSISDSRLVLLERLTPQGKARHSAIVRMGEKLVRENPQSSLGRPASVGTGLMVHWAAHFGTGRDPGGANFIRNQKGVPQYLRFMAFRGTNDTVEVKVASGPPALVISTQGSQLFIPYWSKNRDNIGVALEVLRLGETHPREAWEAAQILSKVENPSYEFLKLFTMSFDESITSFLRNKYPNARMLWRNAHAKRDRAAGLASVTPR